MEEKRENLGELIEHEVRRQGKGITEFAKEISCERNNVYHLFQRGDNINVVQLKRISKALKCNFFTYLADNLDLVDDRALGQEELQDEKAVSQFLSVVPGILSDMGKDPTVIICNLDKDPEYKDCPIAEYALPKYLITFTVGNSLVDRFGGQEKLRIETKENPNGAIVEILTNIPCNQRSLNIRVDYKTEEEWREALKFAFELYDQNIKRRSYEYVYSTK